MLSRLLHGKMISNSINIYTHVCLVLHCLLIPGGGGRLLCIWEGGYLCSEHGQGRAADMGMFFH